MRMLMLVLAMASLSGCPTTGDGSYTPTDLEIDLSDLVQILEVEPRYAETVELLKAAADIAADATEWDEVLTAAMDALKPSLQKLIEEETGLDPVQQQLVIVVGKRLLRRMEV